MWSTLAFLVWMVTTATAVDKRGGCIAGYTPISTKLCLNVTKPGSWTETARSCLRMSKEEYNPFFDKYDSMYYYSNPQHSYTFGIEDQGVIPDGELEDLPTLINRKLVEMDYKEVWWFPNFTQHFGNGILSSWQTMIFYPKNMPRWNQLNSSEGWCLKINKTSLSMHNDCSKLGANSKLPGICLRPRYEQFNLIDTDSCPTDFFTGYGIHPYCLMVSDKFHNGGTSYNWLEASEMCSSKRHFMLQQGYQGLVGRRNQFCVEDSLVPVWINTDQHPFVWMSAHNSTGEVVSDTDLQRLKGNLEKQVVAVNLTTGQWYLVGEKHRFSCVICQTMRVVDLEPQLSLNRSGQNLTLNIINFDSRRQDSVNCYTDASITNTSLSCKETHFSFKMNGSGLVSIFEKKKLYKDDYFHEFVKGLSVKVAKPLSTNRLGLYSIPLEKGARLPVPITVGGSGNYWCVGRNRITLEPLYTQTVLLDMPSTQSHVRYSVLTEQVQVELERASEFSSDLARVLGVTDGLVELKRRNRNGTSLLFHITLSGSSNSNITHLVNVSVKGRFHFVVRYVRYTDFCLDEETFDTQGNALHWSRTARGNVQTHKGKHNCTAAIRECSGDFIEGAFWVSPNTLNSDWKEEWGEACQKIKTGKNSNRLNFASMEQTDENDDELISLHNLSKMPLTSNNLQEVSKVASTIVSNRAGLQSAQTITNFLGDLENILKDMYLTSDVNNVSVVTQDCALLVANLGNENTPVVFSLITSEDDQDVLQFSKTSKLDKQASISVELPESLTSLNNRVALAVFANGNAFQINSSEQVSVNSRVITIVLSSGGNKTHTFHDGQFIDIKFGTVKSPINIGKKQCAFWNKEEGAWSTEGCILLSNSSDSIEVCRCYHLTSFAEIIIGSQSKITHIHQTALDAISKTGCCLSLLGFTVVALTAVVFKKWRADLGNQVLLNLTATMALNLVMYLLIDIAHPGKWLSLCVVHGAVLHYSLIACFCWMLVLAVLQLLRLLTMHGNKVISSLLLKTAAFGWGVPFLPVISLLVWDPHSYTLYSGMSESPTRNFCFPDGIQFYLTVITPVSVIVLINIAVYITIMCRIYSCFGWGQIGVGLQRHGIQDRTITIRRLGTSVFLFFLFGLTWAFGLLAHISVFTTVFSYLFCITATLQGFVMFVFFFIIEKKSRSYWQNLTSKVLHSSEYQSTATKSTTVSEHVPLHSKMGDVATRRLHTELKAQSITYPLTEDA